MEACTDKSKDESPDSNLDFGSIYSDTEDELQNVDSNYGLSDLNTSDCDSTDLDSDIKYSHHPTTWKDLKPELKCVLPQNSEGSELCEKYEFTYLIESYRTLPQHKFCGAPVANFETRIRVNMDNEEQAKSWVDSLSKKTKCTYRVSRTYKPSLKRVMYKIDLHCQHFRKPLTRKQQQMRSQKKTRPSTLLSGVHCKKTNCPSKLSITIQKPPKSKVPKHHDTHKGVVKLTFHHNHPIDSAHVLGFRPVSEDTRKKYVRLFSLGHSASSAHHHYEEDTLHSGGQFSIADRSVNPDVHWVHCFYRKWRSEILGSENGKNLFERLTLEMEKYNEHNGEIGGCAKMQWYSIQDSDIGTDYNVDDLEESQPAKGKKILRENISLSFLLYVLL
uniref:Uncharacterized protein n=1 Tax=Amphimedon queenslandica TaxID=400682 RepID=A0A1X7VXB9_AMPQE